MIKCACPHCGYKILKPEAKAGATIKCPNCKEAVILPDESEGDGISLEEWEQRETRIKSRGQPLSPAMWDKICAGLAGVSFFATIMLAAIWLLSGSSKDKHIEEGLMILHLLGVAIIAILSATTVAVSMRTLFKFRSWIAATCILAGSFLFVYISIVAFVNFVFLKTALAVHNAFN